MAIPVDALFCGSCDGYVHPFLDACPCCGTPREARYEAALAKPALGFRSLLTEPRVADRVREAVLRYSMKPLGGADDGEVREGFGVVAGALSYVVRSSGAAQGDSATGFLHVAEDDLVVDERNPAREIARVPLGTILAARPTAKGRPAGGPWTGVAALGRLAAPIPVPAVDGDLVLAFAAPGGVGCLGIANRRGIFVAQARSDHYLIVGRWLGILAAAAAEARWEAIGPAAHAAELGLVAPASPTPSPVPGAGVGPAGPGAAPGALSVADALATLEDLRVRGLVSDGEYAAKRSEILARL